MVQTGSREALLPDFTAGTTVGVRNEVTDLIPLPMESHYCFGSGRDQYLTSQEDHINAASVKNLKKI